MKKIIALVCLLCIAVGYSQKSCPRNFDGKDLIEVKKKVRKHIGEIVAFDAEVIEVGSGYNDIPYIHVKLDNGEMLWVASMMSAKLTAKGTKLRLLGYIDEVKPDDEIALLYNKDGLQVRAFAMLDHLSKQMQLSNAFEAEAKLWLSGTMPKNR